MNITVRPTTFPLKDSTPKKVLWTRCSIFCVPTGLTQVGWPSQPLGLLGRDLAFGLQRTELSLRPEVGGIFGWIFIHPAPWQVLCMSSWVERLWSSSWPLQVNTLAIRMNLASMQAGIELWWLCKIRCARTPGRS